VVDFVNNWSSKTEIPCSQLIRWIGMSRSKFYDWRERYGKVNEHNALVPRDWWLEEWEKEAIIHYFADHPLDGYRRLAFMMMDDDVVAISPSSVYRVLKRAGLMEPRGQVKSKKGTGFVQPLGPHDHWHIDISYVNICGTFYYLCGVLDGFSRYVVHWELRESMKEMDVEIIVERAKEKFPDARPRIISDNGPQFVARDFKEFVRISGMSHVRTSPYYPQSNGKYERWNGTVKRECIRPKCPGSPAEARDQVGAFVDHYNNRRLHSAIGYVAPADKLAGRSAAIHAERDRKLAEAREARKGKRQQAKLVC
jgi:putative transposase